MKYRAFLSTLARTFGLIYLIDHGRFAFFQWVNKSKNQKFKQSNPTVVLPPDYLMYESFQIDYQKYYTDSRKSAEEMVFQFKKYIALDKVKVLDWGCGPGRIIRHLPSFLSSECEFYGTDYNAASIDWCSKNLQGIHFNLNGLEAKLPYEDNFFEVIYGISIFTHLSESLHYDWAKELVRVLKPGGILYVSTQGDAFKEKMTQGEIAQFEAGNIVVRGKVKEGHRTFSAFHPKTFMQKLFKTESILDHIVIPKPKNSTWIPQEVWVISKK